MTTLYFKVRKFLIYFIVSVMLVGLVGCKIKPDKPRYITDQYGRSLIFHGLNTSGSAKSDPKRLPWIKESDVARAANEWGFNFVRLLIFWDRLEPSPGEYNAEYLAEIAERVNWYAKHHIYVMLDMHQDLYALQFGGDGASEWATITDGLPVTIRSPWWLTYLELGVTRAFDNFWRYSGSHSYLQDHYVNTWQQVADYFKDFSNVIGYDLMNEPYGGSSPWPVFEPLQLKPFYERIINKIRVVDNDNWIFIEPQALGVNFGVPSTLGKVKDSREGESRIVYAPHFYPPTIHEGAAYNGNLLSFKAWPEARIKELNKSPMPLVVGEFGINPNQEGAVKFVHDVTTMADKMGSGWAFWSNDPGGWSPTDSNGDETKIVNALVRVYPRAVAGKIHDYMYNPETKTFQLTFTYDATIKAPTEIYIPAQRHYPSGWVVELNDQIEVLTASKWDAQREVLSLRLPEYFSDEKVKVSIKPKG